MRFIYWSLICLVFIALACIGVLVVNIQKVIDYKQCYNQPITELNQHCKDLLDGK